MIKFNLTCECGSTFESWFSSSEEYTSLTKKKLIYCIYCDSTKVKKSLMTPNLKSKSNKNLNKSEKYPTKTIRKELIKIRKYIEKNCKNVGDNFAQEARNIYYNKNNSNGIYGKASPEETSELKEEGIEVATIPWVDKTEN
tara:strand:- start:593 stop:1015 length:423 start_codon:yes stop_codon:yes gene_type:complete